MVFKILPFDQKYVLGATKKMCPFILEIENCSKSYFGKGQTYSKG